MLADFVGNTDKQLKVLVGVYQIVCFYNAGYKIKYKHIKYELNKALKVIRTAHASGEVRSCPNNKRLLGQQALLLKQEIKGDDYELSQRILKLHDQIENLILEQ